MFRRALPFVLAATLGLGIIAPAAIAQTPDEETFCTSVRDMSLVFNTVDEQPTKKQQKQIAALAEDIDASTPAELSDQVGIALDAVSTGDFQDPTVFEAINTVDGWVADNCGFTVVDITGREFEFDGVPDSVDTGVNLFRFTNDGAELHEMLLVRIKGDETAEELIDLPEKKVEKKVEFIGATDAEQGKSSVLYANLKKPGRYAVLCLFPVGSTDEQAAEAASEQHATPHAQEGMVAEFTVQ